jgi:hypothetical protein
MLSLIVLKKKIVTNSTCYHIQIGDGVFHLGLNPEWKGALLVNFEGDFGSVTRKVVKL